MRQCKRCYDAFEPMKMFPNQAVCAACALEAIDKMAADAVWEMTDEEIEQELREDGVDVEAFKERIDALVAPLLAKRGIEAKS